VIIKVFGVEPAKKGDQIHILSDKYGATRGVAIEDSRDAGRGECGHWYSTKVELVQ